MLELWNYSDGIDTMRFLGSFVMVRNLYFTRDCNQGKAAQLTYGKRHRIDNFPSITIVTSLLVAINQIDLDLRDQWQIDWLRPPHPALFFRPQLILKAKPKRYIFCLQKTG